ncbi:MAG: AfsR/SARP family transcriptional regulator, partial [Actinomycetota bacterium]
SVHVEGADDGSAPGRRRRASELVAYLALHPGASAHEVDEALWPGHRVPKNTRNPFISRVRQWLGRTPDGKPYLPLVADGGEYRLRPEVTCDWHDFLRLARRGLSRGPDGVDDLGAALDLVRARPFLGIDPATYTWAEADIQEMISAIVDVAHVLSVARCELGDYRGAQEAAARGLHVEPCSELLYRDAIRAAGARGDQQDVDRLAERLRRELADLDPDEGVGSETVEAIVAAVGRQ